MRSVFVTKFVPLPADNGGKQRSIATLRRLSALGPTVLCAFDDGTADLAELERLGIETRAVPWGRDLRGAARALLRDRSVTAARFASRSLLDAVTSAVREAPTDVLYVNYSQLVPYARGLPAARRILDLHNVESALLRSYGESARGARRVAARVESAALRRLEREALDTFDNVVVVSETDRERLPGRHPDVLVCPNGWETSEELAAASRPVASFVALLGWRPNAEAAEWLATEIWPKVRRKVPDAELLLVGRDPTASVQALAGHGVTVTGTVPSVRPYLAASRIGLAPLRAGGGSRLKILEALDAGRPVVSTSIGAEGLTDLAGSGLVIADDADAMAAAITRLLQDPAEAIRLGTLGRAAVRDRYGWDTTLAPLVRQLEVHR